MGVTTRAEAVTVAAILLVVLGTMLAGEGMAYFVSNATGFGPDLDLPIAVRALGAAFAVAGAISVAAVLRIRKPRDILDSTAVTWRKFFRRTPPDDKQGRKELFVPRGPYRFVRNPMYMGVVLLVFGLGLLGGSDADLFWVVALVAWFWFIWIPYEERELEALFGESYRQYKRQVPKLFPNGRSFKEQN